MKKININSLKDNSLSREQLKQVVGGSGNSCSGKSPGDSCTWNGKSGRCRYFPFSYGLICWC